MKVCSTLSRLCFMSINAIEPHDDHGLLSKKKRASTTPPPHHTKKKYFFFYYIALVFIGLSILNAT